MQYLASSISTFNLSSFLDKGGVQGNTTNISELDLYYVSFITVSSGVNTNQCK